MEFDLIDRIRARVASRDDVVLGIGDDAAILEVAPGRQLVVAADTLNAGVHFPHGTAAADIGWKALAVNLSDLAAMGAEPAWCTLSLSLPEADAEWLDGFLDGFLELAGAHRVALVGGDTTRGPLSIGVTVHGLVEPGGALRRDGARAGDDIWVSGTLGDAAGALALLQRPEPVVAAACEAGPVLAAGPADATDEALPRLRPRLDRPTPRVQLGRGLAGLAHAAVDVSDGLLADLAHVCRASGVGAGIDIDALPCSAALRDAFDEGERRSLQAGGGDDYELCFTAPADRRERIEALGAATGVALARVGRVVDGAGVVARDRSGAPWTPGRAGYAHFAEPFAPAPG
ncbi:thiamine-monophosphate kinase [Lysobacter arseniciresistens ZS79]|uniref:Thiamine-monophosphate kinase n=1 Tax=Lysobacter arseniciresistens ZS79 TaxID=913325 RepID=A0A0A0EXB7_9GAMM|nr:thiamine-phosphate kinase [Lysobacter arseniciresistens]KGM55169.1 thiamine-monophosphate kinase [Lysobacter arseniciresistens ZS79]